MAHSYRKWTTYMWMFSAACLFLAVNAAPVQAEDVSEQQIIDKLAKPRTRSLAAPEQEAKDRVFIEGLQQRRTRSLSLEDRNQITAIAKQSPKVDLLIHFDFDSAAITPQAEPQLQKLGRALTSAELKGASILLGGHTDARGGGEYNQGLSERRAEAVKLFLVQKFQIPEQSVTVVGYGKQDLANKKNPFAAENRRVQIVNLPSKQEANR